jgi:hypothetical protein
MSNLVAEMPEQSSIRLSERHATRLALDVIRFA